MKALLAQLSSVPGDPAVNAGRATRIVESVDAEIVISPALYLTEFPELARDLARAAADLLVTAAANMEPFHRDHQIAAQAHALENRLPHLYCNRCGEEAGLAFLGGSRAGRSDGRIEAQAAGDERLLAVDFHPEPADDRVDYLAQLPVGIDVRAAANAIGGIR